MTKDTTINGLKDIIVRFGGIESKGGVEYDIDVVGRNDNVII